jgi:hypothetical protein
MISVFGGTGFIGANYIPIHPESMLKYHLNDKP